MSFDFALRSFTLPDGVPGALYASRMPGLWGSLDDDSGVIARQGIDRVICLAGAEELRWKSPYYADQIKAARFPWQTTRFGMPDGGVPADRRAFLRLAREVAGQLRAGKRVLIHCAAGIGRTGMLAVLVLMALGQGLDDARRAVREAGSGSEDPAQRDLEAWAAERLGV